MSEMPTALVVEDDLEIRAFLRRALLADGWHVAEAGTLDSAADHAAVSIPDLIVLDLGLPDGGCAGFIAAIRARSNVPVVVMVARVDEDEKRRALAAGATGYLSKLFGIGARFDAMLRRFRPRARQPHGECQ